MCAMRFPVYPREIESTMAYRPLLAPFIQTRSECAYSSCGKG